MCLKLYQNLTKKDKREYLKKVLKYTVDYFNTNTVFFMNDGRKKP